MTPEQQFYNPALGEPHQSVVLLKPDAVNRRLVGYCLAVFEKFLIRKIRIVNMSPECCQAHYREHVGKAFYPALETQMCSGPVYALLIEGDIDAIRNEAKSIRTKFADIVEGPRNLVHASTVEDARYEVDLWFTGVR